MHNRIPPGRRKLAIVYGSAGLLVSAALSLYAATGLTTITVQVDFLNDLIVIDGIFLGFFSIFAGRDFSQPTESTQRRADLMVMFLFLFSLLLSMLELSHSSSLLNPMILSSAFLAMMYGTLLIVLRLLIVTVETNGSAHTEQDGKAPVTSRTEPVQD